MRPYPDKAHDTLSVVFTNSRPEATDACVFGVRQCSGALECNSRKRRNTAALQNAAASVPRTLIREHYLGHEPAGSATHGRRFDASGGRIRLVQDEIVPRAETAAHAHEAAVLDLGTHEGPAVNRAVATEWIFHGVYFRAWRRGRREANRRISPSSCRRSAAERHSGRLRRLRRMTMLRGSQVIQRIDTR